MTEPENAEIDRDGIRFEVVDGLAHVRLNRPARLNAIDDAAAYRWRDVASDIARREDVRAVLLDAAGPAVCAGGDVAAMAALGGGGRTVEQLADVIHAGHRTFAAMPIPIVAAVQGAVAGGGLGFMLTADHIVAGEAATFASKYADIGLTPDCGVSTLLPDAVGTRRALELTLTDRTLTADEALAWNLVNEVVPTERLTERAREVAAHWMDGAAGAFGQAKRLIRAGSAGRAYAAALDDEARTIGAAFDTAAAQTRIAAFAAGTTDYAGRSGAPASGDH